MLRQLFMCNNVCNSEIKICNNIDLGINIKWNTLFANPSVLFVDKYASEVFSGYRTSISLKNVAPLNKKQYGR